MSSESRQFGRRTTEASIRETCLSLSLPSAVQKASSSWQRAPEPQSRQYCVRAVDASRTQLVFHVFGLRNRLVFHIPSGPNTASQYLTDKNECQRDVHSEVVSAAGNHDALAERSQNSQCNKWQWASCRVPDAPNIPVRSFSKYNYRLHFVVMRRIPPAFISGRLTCEASVP